MMHAVSAIEEHLTADDKKRLKQVLISESDWLLDNLPIKAGPVDDNKPESNFWNGLSCTGQRFATLICRTLQRIGKKEASSWSMLFLCLMMPVREPD
jgi:hypothetical protein